MNTFSCTGKSNRSKLQKCRVFTRVLKKILLFRDTTVQSLTLQPTVKSGIIKYEDSPLVKAVKSGHILVVDEADKGNLKQNSTRFRMKST